MAKDSMKDTKQRIGDDHFRSPTSAIEFLKKKDRVRSYDMQDVVGMRALAWNCDGSALGCGSENRAVTVGSMDPSSCRLKQTFTGFGHEEPVEAVSFSSLSPNIMASCSGDRTVRLWDLRNSKSHTKFPTKDANLYLNFSVDGKFIFYGDKADTIAMIDTRVLKTVETITFKEEINEFVCHPDGQHMFVTMDQGKVEVLSLPTLKRVKTIFAHPPLSTCLSAAISPNEKHLVVGASDACASVWDLEDLICIRMLTRLDYPVRTVSVSHCGQLIACGSEDHFIDISWLESGERIAEIPVTTECYRLAWHPHYYLLAFATTQSTAERERDRDPVTLRVFGYGS